jgi:hypothetical protein
VRGRTLGGFKKAMARIYTKKNVQNNADIEHYQKIIVTLTETERIMKETDKIK